MCVFRAEVVVFNRPPGSASNPNGILAGIPNFNFILAQNHAAVGHRYQPRIALAAPTRANLRSHKQLNWVTGYAANADWP
jgi:hypothetical protein